jgi:alkylhydroperoxidase family enzyme
MSQLIPRRELDQLPADLAAALRPRVERLGYLGEFFKCAAHQPQALRSFMALTDDLKQALPEKLTEVVALTVAGEMQNIYERNQHEQLCRRLGFADEWIRAVNAAQPGRGSALADDERSVQQLVQAVIARHGHGVGPEVEAVVTALGPAATIAILFLIGRYVSHSLFVNALGLAPPVPSPFEPDHT